MAEAAVGGRAGLGGINAPSRLDHWRHARHRPGHCRNAWPAKVSTWHCAARGPRRNVAVWLTPWESRSRCLVCSSRRLRRRRPATASRGGQSPLRPPPRPGQQRGRRAENCGPISWKRPKKASIACWRSICAARSSLRRPRELDDPAETGGHGFRGCIVNISSILGHRRLGQSRRILHLQGRREHGHATWAARLGEYEIPVYEVRPGIIKTDMTAAVQSKYDRLLADDLAVQRRWGTPEDVGKTVAALVRRRFSLLDRAGRDGGWWTDLAEAVAYNGWRKGSVSSVGLFHFQWRLL